MNDKLETLEQKRKNTRRKIRKEPEKLPSIFVAFVKQEAKRIETFNCFQFPMLGTGLGKQ